MEYYFLNFGTSESIISNYFEIYLFNVQMYLNWLYNRFDFTEEDIIISEFGFTNLTEIEQYIDQEGLTGLSLISNVFEEENTAVAYVNSFSEIGLGNTEAHVFSNFLDDAKVYLNAIRHEVGIPFLMPPDIAIFRANLEHAALQIEAIDESTVNNFDKDEFPDVVKNTFYLFFLIPFIKMLTDTIYFFHQDDSIAPV